MRYPLYLLPFVLSLFPYLPLPLKLGGGGSSVQAQPAEPAASEVLLEVEGELESGDAVLTDGSLFDVYIVDGQAGQTISITLESLQFNSYLLVIDHDGETLAENNNVDSAIVPNTQNAWLTLTFPKAGQYRLVVNAVHKWGQGSYRLTVVSGKAPPILSNRALRQTEANQLLQAGTQQRRISQFGNAIKTLKAALVIYQEISDRPGEENALGNLGIAYASLSQYPRAITVFEQQLEIVREIGDRAAEGRALGNLGIVYIKLGQFTQAINLHKQQLEIAREIGDRTAEGKTLGNLGIIYRNLGQYPRAIELFKQRLAIARASGDRAGEGSALGNLGNAYVNLGQYRRAITLYEKYLIISREREDRTAEGNALGNLGIVYRNLGQYSRAIGFFEQDLEIAREIGDRAGEGKTLGNLGNAYLNLGQYRRAIEFYKQDLEIARKIGDRVAIGRALGKLGAAHANLGQYPQAIDFFKQHLVIARAIGGRAEEGSTLGNLGTAYLSLGQYSQAIEFYIQSLAISREIGDRSGEVNVLGNLGLAFDNLGQYQIAFDFYSKSLDLSHKIGDRQTEAFVLGNLGYALDDLDRDELAIAFLKQSINIYENIRGDISPLSLEEKQSYKETVAQTYLRLASLLLQRNRVMEALLTLDLLKVQELQDFFKDVKGNRRTAQGIELLQAEQQVLNGLNLDQLQDYAQSPEVTALMQQLQQTAPAESLTLSAYADLQTRLQNLGTNSALFYPLILEDRLELVLFTRNAPPVHYPVDVSRRELETAIQSFRTDLEDPASQTIQASAQQLYNWLIRPLEADLKKANIETLIYAPDGQMRYVPLAALHDGEKWLVETYQINYITALSLTDIEPDSLNQPKVLAGAFSEASAEVSIGGKTHTFGPINFAQSEVEALAKLYPKTTQLLQDSEFNRSAIASARLNNHKIVHLATHGKLVPGNPEDSFILLNNGEYVTLREIQAWDLPNVALLVLSACQTALGDRLSSGIEIIGFGYQLQQAQVRASIATLWEISDIGTNTLMETFYAALQLEGISQVEALRRAQIALITNNFEGLNTELQKRGATTIRVRQAPTAPVRQQLSHPYYWAPFILIGNGF